MELKEFEEFLERKGQLTRVQVNILRGDLELLTRYSAWVTKVKSSRMTVADLCQLAIHDYVSRNKEELLSRMGNFEYVPRGRGKKKDASAEHPTKAK